MTANHNIFNIASASMAHASKRHQLIANNIAHADTPDYVGKDIKTFSLDHINDDIKLNTSRQTHFDFDNNLDPYSGLKDPIKQSAYDETINSNKVSVEEEIAKAAESIGQHNLASGVWRKSLSILMNVIDSRR